MPSRSCSQLPQAHPGALQICLFTGLCFPGCVGAAAGLEPNEASNSQIIFDHFLNWR